MIDVCSFGFFFSSRRRHTRCLSDWSSDVCSSDLFPIFTAPPDPNSFTGTILSQNTNFKQGRVQQFNVNVEHQLPGHVVLTAGYAGSRASHILVDGNNLNLGSPRSEERRVGK